MSNPEETLLCSKDLRHAARCGARPILGFRWRAASPPLRGSLAKNPSSLFDIRNGAAQRRSA